MTDAHEAARRHREVWLSADDSTWYTAKLASNDQHAVICDVGDVLLTAALADQFLVWWSAMAIRSTGQGDRDDHTVPNAILDAIDAQRGTR